MSVHLIPEHGQAYFTCDFIGGAPGRRSACREAASVRPEQGGLWLDAAACVPSGWTRSAGGHLRPDHATAVPAEGRVAGLTWSGVAS